MRTKAHQRYKNKNGDIVPGVTTITGILNKPSLVPWANKLGLQGIEVGKYVDNLAEVGTCAHYLIECHVKNQEPNLDDYTPNQIDMAENAFLKYLSWEKENKFELLDSELQLVSDRYNYGGTCDMYCMLNGKKTLIDLKTSKGCFAEHHLQVSAYKALLEESGREVEDVRILRVGRDETEGFDDIKVVKADKRFELFLHCLAIYQLQKELKS
jgi:hypothetical protein